MIETNEIALAPPIEPESIHMSFNEPGWIALYLLLIILFLVFSYFFWKRYQKNKYKRIAIKSLKDLSIEDDRSTLRAMEILKSTAMKSFGREELAALTGIHFLEFLNDKCACFQPQTVQKISKVFYQKTIVLNQKDKQQFIQQSQNWIRKHGI